MHAIGETATEIIHIGQAVMALGGTLEYFRDTVFNYPTMAECYKVAALDGLNKLAAYDASEWQEPATEEPAPHEHPAEGSETPALAGAEG